MFKKLFLHSPLKYVIVIVVELLMMLLYFLIRENGFKLLLDYVNATSIAGFAMVMVGLLSLVCYYGAFDIFSYGFSTFHRTERRFHDLHEYSEFKKVVRNNRPIPYTPYMVVGVFTLLISLILSFFV